MFDIREALESAKGDDRRSIVPMTYNLAADTWGGWEDADVVDKSDRAIGLEASRLNIKLAKALGFGPERRKNGYWILGAHLLEEGDYEKADSAFKTSHEFTCQTDDRAAQLMTEGWILASRLLRDEPLEQSLEEVKRKLKTLGDDGVFYAAQFDPALEKFAGKRSAILYPKPP